jgi:hypothetical protein
LQPEQQLGLGILMSAPKLDRLLFVCNGSFVLAQLIQNLGDASVHRCDVIRIRWGSLRARMPLQRPQALI